MKNFLSTSLLALLFACGGKESEYTEPVNIFENLKYTVDTVVVNAKGEIINLNNSLQFFDLSADKRTLLLFDRQQTFFQEIDLDKMELKNTYPFEIEGPNGVARSSYFQILPDGTLMIPTFSKSGIYNLQGELLSGINLRSENIEGFGAVNPFSLSYEILVDPKSGILYSLPGDTIEGARNLAIIDSKTGKGKMIKLPEMEKAGNFRVFWNTVKGKALQTENYSLTLIDDILVITCTVGSGIYLYDTKTENLEYIDFPHKIIPREKSGIIQNEVSVEGIFWEEYRKVVSQISYRELMWDNQTSKFYRLASKAIVDENLKEPTDYEVYLIAYDKDYRLLGETLLKDYNQLPTGYFFKEGKLWSYVNVEDELGFAVFTFNF